MRAFVLMPGSEAPDLPGVITAGWAGDGDGGRTRREPRVSACPGGSLGTRVVKDRLPAIGVIYLEYHTELARDFIGELLSPSHRLAHHQRLNELQGEQMWVRTVD
jgi:hypothetical protein